MIGVFRRHILCRIVALTVCLAFIWQSMGPIGEARAQSAIRAVSSFDKSSGQSPEQSRRALSSEIKVPARYGEVVDSFKGSLDKTIIHIRDAHCDYSAQHSISGIIGHLRETYGIGTIALEGGSGDYDLSVFTDIKDASLREKTADYFVKEGEVNGAEFYAINNPLSVALYGIEEPALYIENLKAYRDSLKFKAEADKCLNTLAEAISKLRAKIYPEEFKPLDEKIRLFREGRIGFDDYAASMAAFAGKKNIDLSEYPNIKRFYEAMGNESGINYTEAERERNILIDMLNKRLSRKYLEELVAKTAAFNDQLIQVGEYYAYLSDKAGLCGIELNKLPNLKKYAQCLKQAKTVNKKALQKEFKALEERMCGLFLTTEAQKNLCLLNKRLFILQNLFSVSLVKEDWDYYFAHRDDFDTKNFLSLLSEKNNDSFARLNGYRERMEKFYSLSLKRDDVFIDKIIAKLKKEKQNNIILVTGGFHQDNLKNLFKDKGYSYIEVLPKVDKEDGKCPYFKLLSGGADPIMRAVSKKTNTVIASPPKAGEAISKTNSLQVKSALQIASYLSPMAKEIYAQTELTAFQLAVAIVREITSQGKPVYVNIPGKGIVKFDINAEPTPVDAAQAINPRDLASLLKEPIPGPGPETVAQAKIGRFNIGGEVKFGTGEGEWQYVDAEGKPSAMRTDTIMQNVTRVLAERLSDADGTFGVTIGGTGPVSQQPRAQAEAASAKPIPSPDLKTVTQIDVDKAGAISDSKLRQQIMRELWQIKKQNPTATVKIAHMGGARGKSAIRIAKFAKRIGLKIEIDVIDIHSPTLKQAEENLNKPQNVDVKNQIKTFLSDLFTNSQLSNKKYDIIFFSPPVVNENPPSATSGDDWQRIIADGDFELLTRFLSQVREQEYLGKDGKVILAYGYDENADIKDENPARGNQHVLAQKSGEYWSIVREATVPELSFAIYKLTPKSAAQSPQKPTIDEIEKIFPRGKLPVKIEIVKVEKRPEPILKADKNYEKDILNAGVLNINSFRLLFARRALDTEIDGVRKSEIGLYIHNKDAPSPEEEITIIDRTMLTPDDKNLTSKCGDVIALEDARVIQWNKTIFVYLTVVEKDRYYSAVTHHDKNEFLEKIKGNRESWNWSPLEKLVNDGPAKDIDVKDFVPFGHPARISNGNGGTKGVWFALYRPDIKDRTTIRYAISEKDPAGPWKDMGEYKAVDQKTGWWLGASAFVAEIKDVPGEPPLEFMLSHLAAEIDSAHKYYDIRVLVSERDNPLSYIERPPIIVPDIENPYETSGWVPGTVYTCGGILTGHNSKDNTYAFDIYYSGSDSVVLMAAITLKITPSTASAKPINGPGPGISQKPAVGETDIIVSESAREAALDLIMRDQNYTPETLKILKMLESYLASKTIEDRYKKRFAEAVISNAYRMIRDDSRLHPRLTDSRLISDSFYILEEGIEQQLGRPRIEDYKHATYDDRLKGYLKKLSDVNDIFQELLNIIKEEKDITYDELRRRLLEEGAAKERFLSLNPEQRALIRAALFRFFARRINLIKEHEEMLKDYPVAQFNKLSQQWWELSEKKEETKNIEAELEILKNGDGKLKGIAQLFKDKFRIKETPKAAIIRLGPFGFEIEIDKGSYRLVHDSVRAGEVSAATGAIDKEVNLDNMDAVLSQFPFYLYGRYQGEMIAYMTSAELIRKSIYGLIESYRIKYEEELIAILKGKGIDTDDPEIKKRLDKSMEAVWTGRNWEKLKDRLWRTKRILDRLVDVEAALRLYEKKKEAADNDLAYIEDRDQAYLEASQYILGIFQFIPMAKAERRLTVILKEKARELKEKGTRTDYSIMRRARQGSPIPANGFYENGVMFSEFGGGEKVFDHERQHLIGHLYTGIEIQRYTLSFEQFLSAVKAPQMRDIALAPPAVESISYAEVAKEMPEKINITSKTLNSIFRGKPYRVIVSGAVPTDDKGNEFTSVVSSGKITGERNVANRLLNEKLNLGIYLAHTMGTDAAKKEILKVAKDAASGISKELISYTISGYILSQLEKDTAFKKELGLDSGVIVESFLRDKSVLEIITDYKQEDGKNIAYLMPYFEATGVGLTRLNLIDRLEKNADLATPDSKEAFDDFCAAVSLLTNVSAEEISPYMKELLAASGQDPINFFKNYNLKLAIPRIKPIDLGELQGAMNAMIEAWRSL